VTGSLGVRPEAMTPSAACIAFIKDFEKCRLTAFKPTPNDNWTIGWGATGPGIKEGLVWTQEQADRRFEADLAGFAAQVNKGIAAHTTQGQFDAMVSLAYNIGAGGFHASTLRRLHNAADIAGALKEFARWDKQAGVALAGLTRRRRAEATMYAARPAETGEA